MLCTPPPSPIPFCLQEGALSPVCLQASARERQVEVRVEVGAGAGVVCREWVEVRTWPMYYCRGSTPQIGSSSSIILSGHLLLPFLYGAVHHLTVPHLLPPVRKSSPCIFISNRSRLHHPQPVSLFQSPSSSFSLPQPPRISPPRLLSSSFPFFFCLSYFLFSFLFSYFLAPRPSKTRIRSHSLLACPSFDTNRSKPALAVHDQRETFTKPSTTPPKLAIFRRAGPARKRSHTSRPRLITTSSRPSRSN